MIILQPKMSLPDFLEDYLKTANFSRIFCCGIKDLIVFSHILPMLQNNIGAKHQTL